MNQSVFILGGKRTPMGEYVGALKDISAIDLGAVAARAAISESGITPDEIDHTIMGNALQTSGDAIYGARHVALKAGVPLDRPALTVNRLCGSGIQSIISGAQMIMLGEANTALVGGMESMSQAPHVIRGARSGFALGQGKLEDSLMVALLDSYCNTPMAGTAENARRYEVLVKSRMLMLFARGKRQSGHRTRAISRGDRWRSRSKHASPPSCLSATITCDPKPRSKVWRNSGPLSAKMDLLRRQCIRDSRWRRRTGDCRRGLC